MFTSQEGYTPRVTYTKIVDGHPTYRNSEEHEGDVPQLELDEQGRGGIYWAVLDFDFHKDANAKAIWPDWDSLTPSQKEERYDTQVSKWVSQNDLEPLTAYRYSNTFPGKQYLVCYPYEWGHLRTKQDLDGVDLLTGRVHGEGWQGLDTLADWQNNLPVLPSSFRNHWYLENSEPSGSAPEVQSLSLPSFLKSEVEGLISKHCTWKVDHTKPQSRRETSILYNALNLLNGAKKTYSPKNTVAIAQAYIESELPKIDTTWASSYSAFCASNPKWRRAVSELLEESHEDEAEASEWDWQAHTQALSEVDASTPRKWIWADKVPLGIVFHFSGYEEMGKSLAAMGVAAQLTTGRLEGEFYGNPQKVLILSHEDDDLEVRLRVSYAGGDISRAIIMNAPLYFPSDAYKLRAAIRGRGVSSVIIDPGLNAMDSRLDENSQKDVTHFIDSLARIAQEEKCTIFIVLHFNKAEGRAMQNRITGSKAFNTGPRGGMVFQRYEDRYIASQLKNSYGTKSSQFYTIERNDSYEVDGVYHRVARVVWGEQSPLTAQEVSTHKAATPADRCEAWLEEYLSREDTVKTPKVIHAQAEVQGFSHSSVRTARKRLGVETPRLNVQGAGTVWKLPTYDDKDSED